MASPGKNFRGKTMCTPWLGVMMGFDADRPHGGARHRKDLSRR
jgi:hypothetical protein